MDCQDSLATWVVTVGVGGVIRVVIDCIVVGMIVVVIAHLIVFTNEDVGVTPALSVAGVNQL